MISRISNLKRVPGLNGLHLDVRIAKKLGGFVKHMQNAIMCK